MSTGCAGWPASSGLLGVPVFIFHEGRDRTAAAAFKQIAGLSHGAYLRFDLASAERLKELLGAVAVYAAGGYRALAAYGESKGGEVLRLTAQLRELTRRRCCSCSADLRSSAACCCWSICSPTPIRRGWRAISNGRGIAIAGVAVLGAGAPPAGARVRGIAVSARHVDAALVLESAASSTVTELRRAARLRR